MQQRNEDLIKLQEEEMLSNLSDEELMQLYEEYMDEEMIQAIIDEDSKDEIEVIHQSGKANEAKFCDSMAISIIDFVTKYLCIRYTPALEVDAKEKKRIDREDRKVNHDYDKSTKQYKRVMHELAASSDDEIDKLTYEKAVGNNDLHATSLKERINVKYRPGQTYTLGQPNYSTLWHSGLKELGSPYLFIVGNDYANKNVDKVYDGELLLVIDAKKSRRTYINPLLIRQLIESEENDERLKVVKSRLHNTGCKTFQEFKECLQEEQLLERKAKQNEKVRKLLVETHKDKNFKRLKEGMRHA